MSGLSSPATTTNHYAKDDPTATSAGVVHATSGNVATLNHPANGVVINEVGSAHTTTPVVHQQTVTNTHTTTAAQPAQPVQGALAAKPVHTIPSGANGDGLLVGSNLGGPLGGSVVLGGQCECLRNGGSCSHGAGACTCRGCTTAATSINPGINIGVSTHQYTAPVGTSGIGGGVADRGVGMSGVVNTTNPIGQPVNAATQNCECVKRAGVCKCEPGKCDCANCQAHRKSLAATQAGSTTVHTTQTHLGHSAAGAPVSGNLTSSAVNGVPAADHSHVPYKAEDYNVGKPASK